MNDRPPLDAKGGFLRVRWRWGIHICSEETIMAESETKMVEIPTPGVAFWPVGSGDSVTIRVTENVFMQVDICHRATAENEETDFAEVIDRLKEILPERDGKPHLAVFVLTHPDKDHCLGFKRLLNEVSIGEIWHSPRVFREYHSDLCDDAITFRKEAKRRVKKTIENGGTADDGDRVRIVGYDDLLKEDDYKGFPKERLTTPGNAVTELNGEDFDGTFRAFIHAPFKDDSTGDRNETSVAMQVSLASEKSTAMLLLFGDLTYLILKKIWDRSEDSDVAWGLMLAAHHCSKSAMYWKNDGEEEESLQQDILDNMDKSQTEPGIVIASSSPVPEKNKDGDNPPHALAKARYEEIASGGFMCTADCAPEPIVFTVVANGFEKKSGSSTITKENSRVAAAVAAARGAGEPPRDRVGFGRV